MKTIRDALVNAIAKKDLKAARNLVLHAHAKTPRLAERKELIGLLNSIEGPYKR